MATISSQMALALSRTAAPSRLAESTPTQAVCWARAVLRAVRRGWMRERGPHHVAALAALSRDMRRQRREAVGCRAVARPPVPDPYPPDRPHADGDLDEPVVAAAATPEQLAFTRALEAAAETDT